MSSPRGDALTQAHARATPRRFALVTLAALAICLATMLGSLALGVEPIRLGRAFGDRGSLDAAILFGARLGRVVFAALVGAALAPAGVAFQALLRNPLADPYVLGVSGGAAVAGTAAVVLLRSSALGVWTRPVWALAGALAAVVVVYRFGRVRGRLVPQVVLLAGVVLNALTSALILAIRVLSAPMAAEQAMGWLSGVIGPIDALSLLVLGLYIAVGLGVLGSQALAMNAFALGEESARTLGVDVDGARRRVFFSASLLTGAAVAFAGPIGFVGLVVPHALRRWVGADHRLLLPAATLVGAAFLVAADTAARLSFLALGTEPTVGVLTALVGAPFFLAVLRRRGGERLL